MFLPLFIAILLGLATPTNTNNNCSHNSGTVVSTNDTDPTNPGDPGTGDPGDDGDTGGEHGHMPPPNKN
ncbi:MULTISPECIES: hypothetical protein [unclassified Pedobacter]|uniref:hypothetical protein n=1 Tax=unclassified Pedobacter TaxID=2628915 RepID=UPI001420F154|nr:MULTISPECIES: hypothetical protein [unclassified Pedobacter]NII84253.1 hypothetical protein [Pedobacter sp. SG908]NMN38832.1 hypothetical protein [Pedobacter sp. SG918]